MAYARSSVLAASLVFSLLVPACGSDTEDPYKPVAAYAGRKTSLPAVPTLSTAPKKVADSYTIFGAIHDLKSAYHSTDVTAKEISITGYIVESNIPTAPKCAVHKMGKKDPDDCVDVPIPSFWIADEKGNTKGQKIRVLGWARNFAVVHDAMEKYKGLKEPPKEMFQDDQWGVAVPFPLPAVGAKVKVTGKYGYTFTKATQGLVSDPANGVMTFSSMTQVEPAPEEAAFAK